MCSDIGTVVSVLGMVIVLEPDVGMVMISHIGMEISEFGSVIHDIGMIILDVEVFWDKCDGYTCTMKPGVDTECCIV